MTSDDVGLRREFALLFPSKSSENIPMLMPPYVPFNGELDALILPEVNAQSMSLFLKELSRNHTHEHIVLILDRAGWHTTGELTIPKNITLHWLPPYSPELNPVEHLWDEIREKWFLNRYFSSLGSVEDQLVEALRTLMKDRDRVKSISLFKWMVH